MIVGDPLASRFSLNAGGDLQFRQTAQEALHAGGKGNRCLVHRIVSRVPHDFEGGAWIVHQPRLAHEVFVQRPIMLPNDHMYRKIEGPDPV